MQKSESVTCCYRRYIEQCMPLSYMAIKHCHSHHILNLKLCVVLKQLCIKYDPCLTWCNFGGLHNEIISFCLTWCNFGGLHNEIISFFYQVFSCYSASVNLYIATCSCKYLFECFVKCNFEVLKAFLIYLSFMCGRVGDPNNNNFNIYNKMVAARMLQMF